MIEQAVPIALKAPFPWFGGKSRVASLVWNRLGNVPNYVEPFFGSGAVLLARPHEPKIETVTDVDCYLSNFWRALQHDPEALTEHANWPVNEVDLHARHLWLVGQDEFRRRMKSDPDYFDPKVAGWWVWGLSAWTGREWCRVAGDTSRNGTSLGEAGRKVHRVPPRQLPHLSDGGMGINRTSVRSDLFAYFQKLAARLRYVRVCCGDWRRILGYSPTTKLGVTGVFLDPPYGRQANRDGHLYACEDLDVAHDVRAWAIEHGDDPKFRIALCGYEDEHRMAGWDCVAWKSAGGYGSQRDGRARDNASRERVWFSPHCLKPPSSQSSDLDQCLLQKPLVEGNLRPDCLPEGLLTVPPQSASENCKSHGQNT